MTRGSDRTRRRRLRELDEERESGLRDLGGLALEMSQRDELDPDLLRRHAARLAIIEQDIEELRAKLGEE